MQMWKQIQSVDYLAHPETRSTLISSIKDMISRISEVFDEWPSKEKFEEDLEDATAMV